RDRRHGHDSAVRRGGRVQAHPAAIVRAIACGDHAADLQRRVGELAVYRIAVGNVLPFAVPECESLARAAAFAAGARHGRESTLPREVATAYNQRLSGSSFPSRRAVSTAISEGPPEW